MSLQKDSLTYKSTIDGRETDVFQYLTEFICQRIAAKDKRSIGAKFWQQETWKVTYRSQLLAARGLLKIYSIEAILKGLRNCPYCYSLRAKFLDEKIKIEQQKIDLQKENAVRELVKTDVKIDTRDFDIIRAPIEKKSTIDKLKELD